jgi:hypothetical protein
MGGRAAYFVDGEVRPKLRGMQAKWLHESHFFGCIFIVYFLFSAFHLNDQVRNAYDLIIFVGLRLLVVISCYGSVVYSNWLHNLDIIRDGTCNTAEYELDVLRWDVWFISGVIFSMSTFILMTSPSTQELEAVVGDGWLAKDTMVLVSGLMLVFSGGFLYRVRVERIFSEEEWVKLPSGEQQGRVILVGRGVFLVLGKLCLLLQLFIAIYTSYATNGWLHSYKLVSVTVFGFLVYAFKSKPTTSTASTTTSFFHEIGGHEVFHVCIHSSWMMFLLSDMLMTFSGSEQSNGGEKEM